MTPEQATDGTFLTKNATGQDRGEFMDYVPPLPTGFSVSEAIFQRRTILFCAPFFWVVFHAEQ